MGHRGSISFSEDWVTLLRCFTDSIAWRCREILESRFLLGLPWRGKAWRQRVSSGGCRGLAKVDGMCMEKRKVRNGEEETLGGEAGWRFI